MAKVLDHGYVTFVEGWGSDERIIESARMSTQGGFKGWGPLTCPGCKDSPIAGTVFIKQSIDDGMGTETPCQSCKGTGEVPGDEKLLRFLWTHDHLTPFEMAGMTLEVQAPIFVVREWQRHRTFSYNELSGRYSEMPDLFYIPSIERFMNGRQSQVNKQGSSAGFSDYESRVFRQGFEDAIRGQRELYRELLRDGVARELSRIILPLGQYTRMRVSGNLRNWLAFLKLRLPENAQWEIRQFAHAVADIVNERHPRTWGLFEESI